MTETTTMAMTMTIAATSKCIDVEMNTGMNTSIHMSAPVHQHHQQQQQHHQTQVRKRIHNNTVSASASSRGQTTLVTPAIHVDASNPNGGTATIPDEIFNLIKNIIGAGVLSLPSGIAEYGDAPSALIPATVLIAIMGVISAYTFCLIAKVCKITGATTYADCWDKTRGRGTAWIVAASSALDCFAGTVTCSMVLADTSKDLLAGIGLHVSRSHALVGLAVTVLLPLCLIRDLSSLAPFSLAGILGMAYTFLAIAVRYFGGAYAMPAGEFVADIVSKPTFGSVGAVGVLNPKSLVLVSMLSTAYIAHFNAPKFYRELKNNTMQRFNTVVASSFAASMAFYIALPTMGFLTFGSASDGCILNNYSTGDVWISTSRFAMAVSLVFSYPLLFVGAREGVMDFLRIPQHSHDHITVILLLVITAFALRITDLTFVASISGAVLGSSLIFIYPALMYQAALRRPLTTVQRWECQLCSCIATFGVVIGGVGTCMAFQM